MSGGDLERGQPQGRWRSFSYEEIAKRDKLNLDITWLRDESLEDSDSLPDPAVLAAEIMEDLQAALEAFGAVAGELEAPLRSEAPASHYPHRQGNGGRVLS
jgi:type I restriction enzyme M protein